MSKRQTTKEYLNVANQILNSSPREKDVIINLKEKSKDELINIIEDCLDIGKIYLCKKCGTVVMQQYACDNCYQNI